MLHCSWGVLCLVLVFYVSVTDFHDLFVCFVALRPKSTAMVIAGRSVHLTTLFPGQYFVHILSLVTDNNPS